MPDHDPQNPSQEQVEDDEPRLDNGTRDLAIGAGIGLLSAGALAAFGAVACPLCVVATPAYLARGAYKRHKYRQQCEQEILACDLPQGDGTDGSP